MIKMNICPQCGYDLEYDLINDRTHCLNCSFMAAGCYRMNHNWVCCPPDCTQNDCPYCIYKMKQCVACGATEESLTSQCRGKQLDHTMLNMIAMGQADYIDAQWERVK